MKTNTTIVKALAFALLITTACNRIEVSVKKGYELPVTINATRQGDNPATRATYNGSTKKLEFSSGDKLLVRGYYIGGGYPRKFAGTLTWVSEGTFSGTITTETQWTGTADALLSAGSAIATLLPNGYESYGFLTITDEDTYSADVSSNYANAFATSKATGVEQLSYEYSDSFSSGFALAPQSAILNFTINGLTASTEYAVVVSDGSDDRGGNVTTNGSGTATFAVGVSGGTESDNITLTVGGTPVTLNLFGGTNTEFVAGHVYNVTRSAAPVGPPSGAIDGLFTINAGGDKVYFSQGNLKYSNGTWSFHTNQYDMCFTSEGSVSANYTSTGTFDLFGYGTSGYNDKYPYMTSMYDDYYQGDIAGTEYDWGTNAISNGGNTANSGWRTLTQSEWSYLLNSRSTTSDVRYAKATVNGVAGLIILPDDWSTSYFDLSSIANDDSKFFSTIQFDQSVWENTFEAHGAVFLPVFGFRDEATINNASGFLSYYWSSTYQGYDSGPNAYCAYYLTLGEYYDDYYQSGVNYVATNTYGPIFAGAFVRLVKDAN